MGRICQVEKLGNYLGTFFRDFCHPGRIWQKGEERLGESHDCLSIPVQSVLWPRGISGGAVQLNSPDDLTQLFQVDFKSMEDNSYPLGQGQD